MIKNAGQERLSINILTNYLIKGDKLVHKRHLNQIKKKCINELSANEEGPMEVPFDILEDFVLQMVPETRRSLKRKRILGE